MIRKLLAGKIKTSHKERIRLRCHEITRIEAFSDGVLAFAISLLIISLEVPKSTKELFEMLKGFIPFAFCFCFIFSFWYEQYKFFRRFGLNDTITIYLNGALIFTILFLVYPLKFLMNTVFSDKPNIISLSDSLSLFILYSVGIGAVYLLFAAMYFYAYYNRKKLVLTEVEVFATKTHLYKFIYTVLVDSSVVIFILLGGKYAFNGIFLYGLMGGHKFLAASREKLFHKKFGNIPIQEPMIAEERLN